MNSWIKNIFVGVFEFLEKWLMIHKFQDEIHVLMFFKCPVEVY